MIVASATGLENTVVVVEDESFDDEHAAAVAPKTTTATIAANKRKDDLLRIVPPGPFPFNEFIIPQAAPSVSARLYDHAMSQTFVRRVVTGIDATGRHGITSAGAAPNTRVTDTVAVSEELWLEDVDGSFYVASYLRAWAVEARWRTHLRQSFGDYWFDEPAAGEWLTGLWSGGQRLRADELLAETLGEVVGLVEFPGFAFGAASLERVCHAQAGRRDFMGHPAGDEKIARVATADFDHIGFGAEARDVGGKDNFGLGHSRK